MTPDDFKALRGYMEHVRDGWVAEPHQHMEMGCRCLSCEETVGWEMGNEYHTTYCDEQETERPLYDQCLQQLFSYREAMAIQLLLKHREEIMTLLENAQWEK